MTAGILVTDGPGFVCIEMGDHLLDTSPVRAAPRAPDIYELMRAIDAYAFDYAKDGKLGASRRTVEAMLNEALQVVR